MVTVAAEMQRDALLWTDVTFSTSYNKCHELTSGWTCPMNKCTGRRKYAFPDPSVIVFSFMQWYVLPPLTIFGTFVFSHYEQDYGTQKVCISGPMFIWTFFLYLCIDIQKFQSKFLTVCFNYVLRYYWVREGPIWHGNVLRWLPLEQKAPY